jgi:uncharacterized membrane protein
MTPAMMVALNGTLYFGLLGVTLLFILPKAWRPGIPFGVSVPPERSHEVKRVLRYWKTRTIALTAVFIAVSLLVAVFKPVISPIQALAIPYVIVALFFLSRARSMLRPFLHPESKVGAGLRRRRYRDYINPWWEVMPLSFLILTAGVAVYSHHWPARRLALGVCAITGAYVYLMGLLAAVLVAHSKQSVVGADPAVALKAGEAYRRAFIRLIYGGRIFFAAGTAALVCFLGPARDAVGSVPFWIVCGLFFVAFLVLCATGYILSIYYGTGGWRWAIRKGLLVTNKATRVFAGDGTEGGRWILGMIYFNPRDPSIIVERRVGIGWTINLGNPWGIALVAGIIFGSILIPVVLLLLASG